MAKLIEVDPNDVQVPPAVHRVLILKGERQLDEDRCEAGVASRRLAISLLGSATIQAEVDGQTLEFVLDAPTRGLLVEEGTSLRVKVRSDDGVVLILEAPSGTEPKHLD